MGRAISVVEMLVTLSGLAVIGFLVWFFFGPKQAKAARHKENIQEINITVKGVYSPDIVRVQKGVPLRLLFDRQEAGDGSSRIVFPDFLVSGNAPVLLSGCP